jgi:hypothetical protein
MRANKMLYLGQVTGQCWAKPQGGDYYRTFCFSVLGNGAMHPKNRSRIDIEFIIAGFKIYIVQNNQTGTYAQREAKDINDGKRGALAQITKREGKIITKHGCLFMFAAGQTYRTNFRFGKWLQEFIR